MPASRLGNAVKSPDLVDRIVEAHCALVRTTNELTNYYQRGHEVTGLPGLLATVPMAICAGGLLAFVPDGRMPKDYGPR